MVSTRSKGAGRILAPPPAAAALLIFLSRRRDFPELWFAHLEKVRGALKGPAGCTAAVWRGQARRAEIVNNEFPLRGHAPVIHTSALEAFPSDGA